MGANCSHQLCELIQLLQREKHFTSAPSNDKYGAVMIPRCFIAEPHPGDMRPHFAESSVEDAYGYLEHLDAQAIHIEIERLKLLHAARALAKFLSAEIGNQKALVQKAEEVRAQGCTEADEVKRQRLEAILGPS